MTLFYPHHSTESEAWTLRVALGSIPRVCLEPLGRRRQGALRDSRGPNLDEHNMGGE
jgi:hypothetical protein